MNAGVRGGWRAGLGAGLAAGVLWAALLAGLLGRPGRSYQSEDLQFKRPNATFGAAAPLAEGAPRAGRRVLTLEFEARPDFPWRAARSIGFPVDVSPGAARHLGVRYRDFGPVTAVLRAPDGREWFRTAPEARLVDEAVLELPAVSDPPAGDPPPTGRWTLELETVAAGRVSVWCRAVPVGSSFEPVGWLRIPAGVNPAPADRNLVLTGHFTRAVVGDPGRVWDLVRFQWRDDGIGSGPRLAWLLAASVLAAGAAMGLWVGGAAGDRRPAWAMGAVVGGATLAIGLVTIVVHPPLSPPDEPDHLLSYAGRMEDRELWDDLLALARRNHAERIRARVYEHFSAADRGQGLTNYWAEHISTVPLKMSERSAATCRVWDATRALVRGGEASAVILRLRLVNVLVLAAALALSAGWLAGQSPGGDRWAAASLALLAAPGVLLFGTQVSNYFLLVSVAAVAAVLVLPEWGAGRADAGRGWFIGLALGLGMIASRASLPLMAAVAVPLALRVAGKGSGALAGLGIRGRAIRALGFWGALTLGVLAMRSLSLPEYEQNLRFQAGGLGDAGFVTLVGAVAALVEAGIGCWRIRARVRESGGGTGAAAAAPAAWNPGRGMIVAVALFLLVPSLIPWDGMPSVSSLSGVGGLMGRVVACFAASLGPGPRDYLLSDTFWRACGYNEVAGSRWPSVLVCAWIVVGWARQLGRAEPGSRVATIGAAVAPVVYLVALAAGSWRTGYDLNGRYLVGAYIWLLAGAARGWSGLLPRGAVAAFVALALPFVVQAIHFAGVLGRFY